jgi:hypothetical protein
VPFERGRRGGVINLPVLTASWFGMQETWR